MDINALGDFLSKYGLSALIVILLLLAIPKVYKDIKTLGNKILERFFKYLDEHSQRDEEQHREVMSVCKETSNFISSLNGDVKDLQDDVSVVKQDVSAIKVKVGA